MSGTKRGASLLAVALAAALAFLAGTGVAASSQEARVPYIVGGASAEASAWPWATALLAWNSEARTGAPFCGGSLVAPAWVLTAAHCVVGLDPAGVPVVVGRPNGRSTLGDWNQAAEFVVHPAYDPLTSRHDLALVRLARPSSQPPVPLAGPEQAALGGPRAGATLVGWGAVEVSRSVPRLPNTLQQGRLSILDEDSCAVAFGPDFDPATQLCAGAPTTSACFGDSGGPLMVPDGTRWVQVGVVSYGSASCRANPAVYTRVSALWPWVQGYVGPPAPSRIAGADRYATAVALSQSRFAPGVPVAYVATGDNFPDALAAGPAATAAGGPILLVERASVPAVTAEELRRLRPARLVVLGGSEVVDDAVVLALAETGAEIVRQAGADRYATAAGVSATTFAPAPPAAYVAVGTDFPDALAAAAAAGARRSPLLLVAPDAVPAPVAAELARLRPASVVVVSTDGAVSQAVQDQLAGAAAGAPVRRVGGPDRYATAAAVSADTFSSSDELFMATGLAFPDALTAGVVAATAQAPLLLVPGTCVPAPVEAEVARLSPKRLTVLGGGAAVAPAVENLTAC